MDLDKVLEKRRSVRRYSMKKVPLAKVLEVCEAARFSPMAGNIYSLRLLIVSDIEKKRKLADAALGQDFVAKASHVIVVCSEKRQVKRSYGSRAEMYVRHQAGAAIENMVLKVADLKLASCWVGAFDDNAVKRILVIPDDIQVEALLPIAFPFGKVAEKKKPDLDLFLYFDKWGQATEIPERKPMQ